MLLNSFLFRFWDKMIFFWNDFDAHLLRFFKPQDGVLKVFTAFLAITAVYSLISFIIAKKKSKQTINLILILYEFHKEDVVAYLQRIYHFHDLFDRIRQNCSRLSDLHIDFSSDDESSPKFDDQIQNQSKQLSHHKNNKNQSICILTRSV